MVAKKKSGNTRNKIVEAIREGISEGKYSPGSKLPTVRELGTEFGTSHANAAAAVNILTEEGLLTKRQGSGVYVPRLFEPEPDSLRLYSYYPINGETRLALQGFCKTSPETKLYNDMPLHQADICISGHSGIRDAARKGQLLSLNETLASAGISPDDFHPGALATGKVGEDIFCIPLEFSPELLFFNRDLFRADRDRLSSWTMDDLYDYVKEESPVLKKKDVHPYVYSLCFSTQIYPYLPMFGADIVDDSKGFCLIDQPEALAAFQFFADLIGSCPERNLSHGELKRLFADQRAVLKPVMGSYNRRAREQQLEFVDVVPMPRGKHNTRSLCGTWVGISASCRNLSGAQQLINYLASNKTHRELAESHSLFPGRLDGIEHLKELDSDCYGPLVDRLNDDDYIVPKLGNADLVYLNNLLEEWFLTDNLLNYLRIAGRKLEQRLRAGLDVADETPGL